MKTAIAAIVVVALAQVALGRPQSQRLLVASMPPLETTLAPAMQDTNEDVSISSKPCPCPKGDYHCNPCWNKVKPKYLTMKVYDTDYRPFHFAYLDQKGTAQEQMGFLSGQGPSFKGSSSYTDICTGAKIDLNYKADHNGYRPSAISFTDGSPQVQGDDDFQLELFPILPVPPSPIV